MGVGEGLGNFYRSLEDRYYGALDWLDERGLSLYPVVEKLEDNGVKSFPVAVIVVLLILAGLFFGLGTVLVPQAKIVLVVSDEVTGLGLENASVKAVDVLGQEFSGETDADGLLELGVPAGELDVEVSKQGYEPRSFRVSVSGTEEREVELSRGLGTLNRTIQLMQKGTSQLVDDEVQVIFTCSNEEASFEATKTSSLGIINLDVPSNCENLVASPVSGYTTDDGIISLEEQAPQLFLEEAVVNSGTVRVLVESLAGEALGGMTVMVYSQDSVLRGTNYTNAAGTAVFDSIPTGKVFVVVHDSQGRHASFDSSKLGEEGVKELAEDDLVSFEVKLEESVAGKVKVMVKDSSTQQPVENALVYLKKDGKVAGEETSGSEGTVEFDVSENTEFELEVDAGGYLIAVVKNVTAGETFSTVFLEPASADNTQVLSVEVVDSRQKPIEGVRLVLKKADGTIYANNVVTGSDGMGDFTGLPLETYYVYAVKKGFEGKNSDPITIKARQENLLRVVLPIGFGNLEVVVLNDEMQPVQGAVVEAINVLDDEKEAEEITNLEGRASFEFRADKKVYFRVDAQEFLPYYSIAVMPDEGSTVSTEIMLAKDPGQLQVNLLGLYKDGELAPKELVPGAKYVARLLLLLPRNSHFDEAGLHLRVGNADEGKTNIMEEDGIYLKDVAASTASILRGTSFTPPKGYAIDSAHLTTGDSKWANFEWDNVSQGAYAVEAEVQVEDSVSLGQILYISYRGWGNSGRISRFPADADLAGSESTAAKHSLYANTRQRAYTAGPSNLCGASFCKTFSIEDKARAVKVNVTSQYSATIGGSYKLNFLISSTADQAFTNAEISLGSRGDGLRFGDYAITDAAGLRSEGSVEGYEFSKEIGDMRKESSVFGFIDFETEKEGSNILTIDIKSNNLPVLSETVDIKVAAAEQLQLDIIPKEIIPGIDNKVLVRVRDEAENPVSNAIVSVKVGGELVLSRESNGSGIVEFKLESPASGTKLVIEASKTGYKDASLETDIDSEILSVTPPEISERLDIAFREIEKQLWIGNQTVSDLVISKVSFSNTFEGLVEFELDDDYAGEKLDADSDINAFLTIRLSEKGLLVTKPVKLEGSLSIQVYSPEEQLNFVENVPIEIRISQGGDVDELKCLELEPVEWEILTSSDEAETMEFTLKNNCRVENEEVPLSGLEARVEAGKGDELGKFTASSQDLPGSKTVLLSENGQEFSETVPAGFEGKVSLEFDPNSSVDSGTSKPNIVLEAKHASSKGEERVSVKLPVELHISQLSKCVEVVAEEPIIVETVPFNLGYGLYSGSYNPYYSGGYGGYQTGSYGYGVTSGVTGYSGGSLYPYSNFTSPYYSNYYNTQQDNSWRYGLGESSFIVKNECASTVEIDLDLGSQLRVEEDSFELDPNEDRTVRVEAGYRMGKYEIGVSAKRKGSEDKKQKVESIDVIVRRQGEIDEECIKMSSTKIEMNNFIGKPVKSEIYNYCYDVGVRLARGSDVIKFYCRLPGQALNTYRFAEASAEGSTTSLQATTTTGTIPVSSGTVSQQGLSSQGYIQTGLGGNAILGLGDYGSQCEMIDQVIATDAFTRGDSEGKTIETVQFEVRPQLNYRKMVCNYMSQMPFQSIFGLRVMLSQAYYRVFVDSAALVQYSNPFGGTTNKYFQVELEDTWGIGDTVDECIYESGKPAVSLEKLTKCREKGKASEIGQVVNSNALDLTKKQGFSNGFVPQSQFSENGVFIYEAEPPVLNIPPAGAQDSITKIREASFTTPNNVKVSLKPVAGECWAPVTAGNWTVKLTIDRTGMPDNVQCEKIDKQVELTIERPAVWSSPRTALVNVKAIILNKGVDPAKVDPNKCGTTTGPVTQPVEACDQGGETGKAAFEKFGFDKLPFNWTWKGIEKDECDQSGKGMFCDSVQFGVELAKKGSELKAVVESLGSLDNEGKVLIAFGESEPGKIDQYKDSSNLFRWVKKQVIIKDNSEATEKSLVFFLKGDKELLTRKIGKGGIQQEKLDDLAKGTEANMETLMGYMSEVLNMVLADSPEDAESIVAVFEKNTVTQAYEDNPSTPEPGDGVFADMGIEWNAELEKYVWTFKEFRAFNQNLEAVLDLAGTTNNSCFDAANQPTDKQEEVVICYNVKSLKKAYTALTLESNVLKAIVSANLEFVVGVRHTKEMSADLKSKVKKEAADLDDVKKKLSELGYSDFAQFYDKAVEFEAFLVKDGYSQIFVQDFETKYGQEPEVKAVKFGKWGFELDGKRTDTDGAVGMQEAGQYKVLLDYKFGSSVPEDFEWDALLTKTKGLSGITPNGSNYAKNAFFEMPLDGELGSGSRREGYGITYSSNQGKQVKVSYDNEETDTEDRFIDLSPNTSGGIKQYTLNYGDSFLTANTGTIMNISGNEIQFNPSKPARLQLTLNQRQEAGPEGIIYDLLEDGKSVLEEYPLNSNYKTESWIVWKGNSQEFKDSGFPMQQAQALCKEIGLNDRHGFIQEFGNSQKAEYTGVAFVPFEKSYELRLICNQGSAVISGTTKITPEAGHVKGRVGLNLTGVEGDGTMKGYVDRIEKGEVCVVSEQAGMKLAWNTKKFFQ